MNIFSEQVLATVTVYGLNKYWINTHTTEKRKDKCFVLQLDNSDSLIDTKFHCAISNCLTIQGILFEFITFAYDVEVMFS